MSEKYPQQPPPQYGYGGLGSQEAISGSYQQHGYQQHVAYPPPAGPPPPTAGQQSGVHINQSPKFQDLWASVLFGLLLASFAVLAAIAIPAINASSSGSSGPLPVKDAAIVIGLGVGTASLMSAFYYWLMMKFPGFLVRATFVFAIISNFLLAAFFFVQRQWGAGIIWVVLAIIFAWVYWSWRSRIPFAILMLENVLDVASRYPSLFVVAFVQLVFTIGWVILWSITVVGLTVKFAAPNSSTGSNSASAPQIILWVYSIFSMYWVAQVIANVGHVTTAGLYATYYFLGIQNPASGTVDINVSSPVLASFKRASTTSFGSICFGSLLIAIIQTLRAIAENSRNRSADNGNLIGVFIGACLACLLQMLGDLVEYFNVYAFAEVAIYGKDYCSAAKDTWNLVKRKGVDAIINDSIVGNVLGMGTLLVGVLSAAVGGVYVAFSDSVKANWFRWAGTTNPAGVIVLGAVVCLMIGFAIFGCVASIINAGVATTFVCMAEDPYALARTKPALFQEIQRVYPQINFYVS
ncbi:DUF580-domain-containing protein [Gonapodya prolifera JEL478]|uniref:Protein PNS1 n=1 Tax=Gonapodya prolifera (strain JEL478) TaxID=1344416 RepID=A0A139A521_GONPJ|nr:DUF580-domain-containing protein [Gonapodya prolifera JEL478]|eukprot:KXS11728.1 DUF580-domain-containing protein [Gonapodya prolifera JEL478]